MTTMHDHTLTPCMVTLLIGRLAAWCSVDATLIVLLFCCCFVVVLLLLLLCCSSVHDEDGEDDNGGDDDLFRCPPLSVYILSISTVSKPVRPPP